jgi:hypothetical protein
MRFLVRRSLRDSSSWPQRLFFSTSHSGFSSIYCRASTPHVRKISPRSLCLLLLCCPRQPQPQGFGRIASDDRRNRTHEAFWPVSSVALLNLYPACVGGGGAGQSGQRGTHPSVTVVLVTQTTLSFLCRHRRRCLRSHRPLCHFYVATGGGVFGHTDHSVISMSPQAAVSSVIPTAAKVNQARDSGLFGILSH